MLTSVLIYWAHVKSWLKMLFFGPCAFPGEQCDKPGKNAFTPFDPGRPVYLCDEHFALVRKARH